MTTTSGQILRHTTAFLSEALSQSDLRHRILSSARLKIPSSDQNTLRTLAIASDTLESVISTTTPTTRSSSLRLTKKLLLSSSAKNSLSALLLSLIYSLCHRPTDAALHLLDIFLLDPSSARSEIAPSIFEDLFLLHLLPVLQWFKDQRSRILSSISPEWASDGDERSRSREAMTGCEGLFSRMSGGQAAELKELERDYEDVVDENSRVFARYLKGVLENGDGNGPASPPPLILARIGDRGAGFDAADGRMTLDSDADARLEFQEIGLRHGRYNPMWMDGAPSMEFESSSSSSSNYSNSTKSPPLYPQRVSPNLLSKQHSNRPKPVMNLYLNSDSELAFPSENHSTDSSSESELETEEKNRNLALFQPNQQTQFKKQKQPVSAESSRALDPLMADSDNMIASGRQTPPKDFVCPITSHLFVDPVTLETGQTYERKAIQEWVDRGNSTCPITRQKLQSTQLPKTNYVLKRLIASWQEQNPGTVQAQKENLPPKSSPVSSPIKPSTSPTSVISQATIDSTVGELRLAISHLCMSEILSESEMAVLSIERFWRDTNMESEIQSTLSKPAVINGFVEILFNSVDPQVLRATVFLLSELASRDKAVVQTLTRVESDVDCVVALFKKGLVEAVVLIYLLRSSWADNVETDMVKSLLMVIKKKEEDSYGMCLKPKTASVLLLGQILRGIDHKNVSMVARAVVSERAIESVVGSLEADWVEERIAAVGILLRCIEEDRNCRNTIADKAELAPVLESFAGVNDGDRFEIVHFLSELVKLNRRTFNEQLLHIIKDEGAFSTMHTLLVYLQTALQDQCPVIAGLILQLDLLAEPRKMSIYREEAMDALISCLRKSDFPGTQIAAAETIMALQGRFSSSGEPLTRVSLLKRAGFDKRYRAVMQSEQKNPIAGESDENLEEEKAAEEWERKMAFVLVSHEFGLVFEALAEGLKSRCAELSSACFVSAAWLTHMLTILPDTGIRGAARVCLLKRFISILKSARDTEDKILAMLALSSFMDDSEGLRDLTCYVKDILKNLRDLKKSSALASKMMKVFSEGQDSSMDLWNHKELIQVDCSTNGEVLSVTCFKDKIFSGHSDGTIKVWSGRGTLLHLIHETKEHSKAVTSLAILQSAEKLYSGSLDRTIRTWSIQDERIQCIQVHDVKDHVQNLTVANTISCFIPQGAGVKVHSWNGDSKSLNVNKHVRCLALVQGKLYCGCSDSSIQEIDLATGTMSTIQTGSRKLLGKANSIYAMQVHDGLLYSAGTSLDGAAVKIWSASTHSMVGSLPSTMDVRSMTVSAELIYLGCKTGGVEIWSKELLSRVETLQTKNHSKVLCLAVSGDGDILVGGTSDGRIQAWGLT
ncbi:putative E3 ubiquitin-protein ligase LIN-1 [Magnolia sinica]|uniref:putative E3 ubiquitin-protein ligase LIN-1 n=1 Tax=Magnolia sinica TaxID=86752 RepID=UPI002658A420|nr:putative E3 ubiquitin-protein ligase LIN-1 [Magnolia sinica]